jgi:hypothetical protein
MDPQRWARIGALFDELIERDAVGSLLAAEAVADERLRELELPAASADDPRQTTSVPDPFGFTGRTLSHFHVLEPIAAGGMDVV